MYPRFDVRNKTATQVHELIQAIFTKLVEEQYVGLIQVISFDLRLSDCISELINKHKLDISIVSCRLEHYPVEQSIGHNELTICLSVNLTLNQSVKCTSNP